VYGFNREDQLIDMANKPISTLGESVRKKPPGRSRPDTTTSAQMAARAAPNFASSPGASRTQASWQTAAMRARVRSSRPLPSASLKPKLHAADGQYFRNTGLEDRAGTDRSS